MNNNQGKSLSHGFVFTTTGGTLLSQGSKECGAEIVQGLDSYEMTQEQREFTNAIAQGLVDVSEGRTVTIDEARKCLGFAE